MRQEVTRDVPADPPSLSRCILVRQEKAVPPPFPPPLPPVVGESTQERGVINISIRRPALSNAGIRGEDDEAAATAAPPPTAGSPKGPCSNSSPQSFRECNRHHAMRARRSRRHPAQDRRGALVRPALRPQARRLGRVVQPAGSGYSCTGGSAATRARRSTCPESYPGPNTSTPPGDLSPAPQPLTSCSASAGHRTLAAACASAAPPPCCHCWPRGRPVPQ